MAKRSGDVLQRCLPRPRGDFCASSSGRNPCTNRALSRFVLARSSSATCGTALGAIDASILARQISQLCFPPRGRRRPERHTRFRNVLVVDTTSRPRLTPVDETLDNVEACLRSLAVLAGRAAPPPPAVASRPEFQHSEGLERRGRTAGGAAAISRRLDKKELQIVAHHL